MPVLENPRREKFCQYIARGMSGAAAYRKAYGQRLKNPKAQASALIKDNLEVSSRIEELAGETTTISVIELTKLKEFLTSVILTPISAVTEDNPLVQSVRVTDKCKEIKMVSKLGAADLLAKMQKWIGPENAVNVHVGVSVAVGEEKRQEIVEKRLAALKAGKN